ncbi:MAG: glycosyltransferase family 2 protein [Clostridiales bacterium]|nr:glycosyltransferase family 2 protein [Clostridiales bacterium]
MPEISVIVPVYKAEDYLHACVDSILSQTVSDFELILVDDGSPDGCGAICDDYAARDSRVRVIHQENQGQAAARNHAFSIAKGEWVCFVDSDDAVHPQMLERLGQAAAESGAAMSMCRMLEAPEMPEDFSAPVEVNWELLSMEEAPLVALFDAGDYPGWVACAKLIRRELVQSHLFCPGRVYEDNEAVCHWIYGAKTVASIPHSLYFYRTNPGSTTQSRFSMKKLDYLWALEGMIRFYSSVGYTTLRERFGTLYAEEAAGDYHRVRYELNDPKAARDIEKAARRLRREIPFTKAQFETMFSAMHPKLVRLYWPLEGAARTLREDGVSGLIRKVGKHLRKGENG